MPPLELISRPFRIVTSACQEPHLGSSSAASRRASRHPAAGSASGLRKSSSGAVDAAAARWHPPAKPRFRLCSSTRACGAASRTVAAVPSPEALSTTTSSSASRSCAGSAASVVAMPSALSKVTITTAIAGGLISRAPGSVARRGLELRALFGGGQSGVEVTLGAEPLLKQREPLSEDLRLVGEARHRQREVEQQHEDEPERDEEQGVRWVGHADRVGHALEEPPPDRKAEEYEGTEEPEQRVAFEQPAPAREPRRMTSSTPAATMATIWIRASIRSPAWQPRAHHRRARGLSRSGQPDEDRNSTLTM